MRAAQRSVKQASVHRDERRLKEHEGTTSASGLSHAHSASGDSVKEEDVGLGGAAYELITAAVHEVLVESARLTADRADEAVARRLGRLASKLIEQRAHETTVQPHVAHVRTELGEFSVDGCANVVAPEVHERKTFPTKVSEDRKHVARGPADACVDQLGSRAQHHVQRDEARPRYSGAQPFSRESKRACQHGNAICE